MTDHVTTPTSEGVISVPTSDFTGQLARAIADPGQVLPRVEGESVARWGARAVEATLKAAEKEFVDGQVAQANVLGWNMDAGVTDLQVSIALETATGLGRVLPIM